jgi:alkanesulfonate monooxygenase SsuD/methylene tetrahydromethanopterin reductase-like flavin-dependent oxidoreductase (luciferase family)
MHVGYSTFFQNLSENLTDHQIYQNAIELADMAEPLGFESIWAAEHHFTEYTMCPNVAQFLTYMAGRTQNAKLGAMAYIVPWHDPVRLAEEISVLDNVSDGRAILGFGRGLGRVEFDAFRLNMGESRERFVEYTDAILKSLETGYIEYDGKHYKQPKAGIRPAPFKSFRDRSYAAAVSPESARIMARLGIGILIIPQKPWETTKQEVEMYREIFREENNGAEPPKPIIAGFIGCHEDESIAREMLEKYIRRYCLSAVQHYEFDNADLANIKGYEYYGGLAKNINKHGIDTFVNFLADLQIWGTPDQVFEQMMEHQGMVDSGASIGIFSYGGMPHDMAKANLSLFAEKVLPRLKAQDVGEAIGGLGTPLTVAAE